MLPASLVTRMPPVTGAARLRRLTATDDMPPARAVAMLFVSYSSQNRMPAITAMHKAVNSVFWSPAGFTDEVYAEKAATAQQLDQAERVSLMFGLGMNNNGTGLVLASLALSSYPNIMVPIIFYNLVQHIAAGIVQEIMSRRSNDLDA